jgi:serine protease Do
MLKIDRDGQQQTVELRLASLRSGDLFEQMTWRILGLRLVPVPSAEFRDLNTRYRGGLRITAVRSDSAAAAQGIQSGDVLVGMHVWETISQENVRYVLNHSDLERFQPIKFYVVRGRETLYGHLTIDPLQVQQVARPVAKRRG